METGVLFLDGDLEGQLVFGIPNIPEYKRVLSMDETLKYRWCGEEDCCERPTEPDVDLYYITSLGRSIRVATTRKGDAHDKDLLAFRMAELTGKLWWCSPIAAHSRWKQQQGVSA